MRSALFIAAAASVATLATAQTPPACFSQCFATALQQSGTTCGSVDLACLCNGSEAETQAAEQVGLQTCAAAGVTVDPSAISASLANGGGASSGASSAPASSASSGASSAASGASSAASGASSAASSAASGASSAVSSAAGGVSSVVSRASSAIAGGASSAASGSAPSQTAGPTSGASVKQVSAVLVGAAVAAAALF
ncbi:hypothetical protein OIV83_005463 [Microbotryomycetes sp. JL201]|nr:hypothetical protein OIV83_005463 [Microbotryomycetes sp. JL201]